MNFDIHIWNLVRAAADIREEKMAYQTFLQEYMQMPLITRAYTTACVLTTIAVVRW